MSVAKSVAAELAALTDELATDATATTGDVLLIPIDRDGVAVALLRHAELIVAFMGGRPVTMAIESGFGSIRVTRV